MELPGKRIPINSQIKLILRVAGDLMIQGWGEADLVVTADHERDIHMKQETDVLTVIVDTDASVHVPAGVDVRLEHTGGDGMVSDLSGSVEIGHVGGDLVVKGAGRVDVNHVGGELTALDVGESLTARRIGGDLSADVTGDLSVDMVGGDSKIVTKGGVRLQAGGDIEIGLSAESMAEVNLRAGGDIAIHAPANISAKMDLTSGSEDIEVDFFNQCRCMEQKNYLLTLGNGDRAVRARAGGDIHVSDSNIAVDDIRREGESKASKWGHRHAGHPESEHWMDFQERITRRAEEAARRAERRVKAAMERVERHSRMQEHSIGKWGKWFGLVHVGGVSRQPDAAPQPPEPPSATPAAEAQAPVNIPDPMDITNEERMLVLKMLQEKKISVEEAEQLLAALEGQFE